MQAPGQGGGVIGLASDAQTARIKVSAEAIRMGLVVKPIKRTYRPAKAAVSA
ncbi:MAG TPA: hypothetical protein VHY56_12245 [Candidatus Binataceae bacterium]|nr:hypothetical protein [Candidatus Binataceae bacterium]